MRELSLAAEKRTSVTPPLIDALLSGGRIGEVLRSAPAVLLAKEGQAAREAEDYMLKWGGMPALLPLQEEQRWHWLRDYEYTYLGACRTYECQGKALA